MYLPHIFIYNFSDELCILLVFVLAGSDRKQLTYRLLSFYYVGGRDRITLSMQHRNNVLFVLCYLQRLPGIKSTTLAFA